MNIESKLKILPKKPGCYIMRDEAGEIIYVGKAKNLFNRVRSYFRGSHDAKTTKLVSNIADFEYIITSSETEAFILEINLIKKHNPKYNISLTDDKQYPYILVTEEEHPRLYYTRDLSRKGKYYGPYPNSYAAKEVVDFLNRIHPLRKCHTLPKKECLYYHIGQCLAPCILEVKPEEYDKIIGNIHSFLKGNVSALQKRLEELMYKASEDMKFEKAIEYRNLIADLNTISIRQKMELDIEDTDVFAYYVEENYISIQVFHIRGRKTVERNGFLFEIMESSEEMFINFLGQFYLIQNNPIPKEILIPDLDISAIEESLRKRITIPKIGKKKEFVDLVYVNAKEKLNILLNQEKMKYEKTLGAVIELGKTLGIKAPLNIEAFDNSNIQGTSSVSAMVNYVDGKPVKKNYRKYKIKTVEGSNDYLTMIEVITRRYTKLKQNNSKYPDLIIVDGGKIQVNAALEALKNIDVVIPVLGLGKDQKHKTSYLFYNDKEIKIDKKSNLFYFLENLQDEVHRYAITFHHLTHTKNTLSSRLDNIKGIGKVKKKQILLALKESNFKTFEDKLLEMKLKEEQIEEILKLVQ
ncbi:MAG: excinuclease ABC subunit UvrC [Bacilli bacterium]|nr:excinuclease ABC subunit UvrC [Bacilli bacterium]